uniref:Uncharacterized protein n=1 Tax=Rhipicephalus zambeziensis TaxID=60191 RepID=A0A224Y823_9ACAR
MDWYVTNGLALCTDFSSSSTHSAEVTTFPNSATFFSPAGVTLPSVVHCAVLFNCGPSLTLLLPVIFSISSQLSFLSFFLNNLHSVRKIISVQTRWASVRMCLFPVCSYVACAESQVCFVIHRVCYRNSRLGEARLLLSRTLQGVQFCHLWVLHASLQVEKN